MTYPWAPAAYLTATDLNAAFALAYSIENQAMPNTVAALTALLLTLPTTLPTTSGKLWLDGGAVCIS